MNTRNIYIYIYIYITGIKYLSSADASIAKTSIDWKLLLLLFSLWGDRCNGRGKSNNNIQYNDTQAAVLYGINNTERDRRHADRYPLLSGTIVTNANERVNIL